MPGADPHPSPLSRPVALSSVIEHHLEKILRSHVFATSDSLRRLLRFVVHETIAGRGDDVKEYSLGVSVLRKGDSFDPKADPIVRVQMLRLRERLAQYYAVDGRHDPLIIDIPKGRYMPTFRMAEAEAAGAAPAPSVDDEILTIGHQKELAALHTAFESAVNGRGHMFCLAGEPGIGKTTVVELFLRQLSSGARCFIGRGRCSERLVGSDAYLSVLEALEGVMRFNSDLPPRLVMDVAPAWYQQIRPRTDGEEHAVVQDGGLASQERLKRELIALLKGLAREHPVVLFLDDLHWADPSTVDALAYGVPRLTSDRILIVGTFRPAELQAANQAFFKAKLELQGHDVCRELPMARLSRLDVDRYLQLQFPNHRFPVELAARVHDRTEGNPLFMADLVRFLRDRGVLAERDGHWVMTGEPEAVGQDLPESIRSMVLKKIAQLTDGDRRLMSAAAVLGPRFDSTVVARALRIDVSEVEDRLEALDRTIGFVRLIGEQVLPDFTLTLEYSFAHVLYQHALDDALTPTRRAALSLALAEALAAVRGGESAEVASQLAWLFEEGRAFGRASDFFLLASQNAATMCAAEQAILLARRAIANAEKLEGPDRDVRVMAAALQSAVQQQSLTRLDAAVADFEMAERAAVALGDPVAQVNAIFGQAAACFLAKRIPEVKERGMRALKVARATDSPAAIAAGTAILAMERVCVGDVAVAERQFDEAIPVLRQVGFVHHALAAVLTRGLLHTWRLEHREADEALDWARGRARELHANFEVLIALWHQARVRGNQGRLSEAWAMLEDALRLAELLGDRFWRPRIENTRGWLLGELFDTTAALRLNTEAVRMAREFGDVEAECNSHINAARDYLALGEPHNARAHLEQAEARYQDDVWFRWVYYPRLQAEMASYWMTQGNLHQARISANASLEDAVRTSSRKRIAWARKLLGDIATLDGQPDGAVREFRSSLAALDGHPCPTIEWQVLRSAAGAAAALNDDEARRNFLGRAGTVVHSLADSIRDAGLQAIFLRSKSIRDLLQGTTGA